MFFTKSVELVQVLARSLLCSERHRDYRYFLMSAKSSSGSIGLV
jgi:hypothetical protein